MTEISLVLFDLDDVLCSYDRSLHIEHIAALASKRPNDVYTAIWGSGYDGEADSGAFDANEYLKGCGDRIGYPLTRAEWIVGRRATTAPMLDVISLARSVKRNAQIAVLTNNTTLVSDHIDEFLPELRPLFGNAIHVSAEFYAAKPSKEAYQRCVDKLNVPAHRTLFIDNLEENVVGARSAGLQAYCYTTTPLLKNFLLQHGLV
jgi:FMN phosphatase YigB (HAD superfamily)